MLIDFRKEPDTAALYANYVVASRVNAHNTNPPGYAYEQQQGQQRQLDVDTNSVHIGDITVYLSLIVAVVGGAAWLFSKLNSLENYITRQTVLTEQSLSVLNKLTAQLEKHEQRIDLQDKNSASLSHDVNHLSEQMSVIIKTIDDIEEFLHTATEDSGMKKRYNRRIRFLPVYRLNTMPDLAHHRYPSCAMENGVVDSGTEQGSDD